MKYVFLILFFASTLLSSVHAAAPESKILTDEYNRLYQFVISAKPDGMVGGLLHYKKIDNYEILWKIAENETDYTVIRLYHEHQDGTEDFAIAYYYADHIVPGTTVIRRFLGPAIGSGWRGDTIDVVTGDYLGYQGLENPITSESDKKIMKQWKIQFIK